MQATNRLLDFPKPVFSMLWQFMQRFSYELAVLSRFLLPLLAGIFYSRECVAIKCSSACA